MKKCFVVSMLLSAGVAGCSTSGGTTSSPAPNEPVASDSGPDGACILPLPRAGSASATSCPAGCQSLWGPEVNARDQCVDRNVLIGCFSCRDDCGGPLLSPCYKHLDDGRIVRVLTDAVKNRSDWVLCTESEQTQLTSLSPCD